MTGEESQPAADSALLATKRFAPRRRARMVSRSRLLTRLDQGLESALTLVAAPAGSGKTTLLADWLATHQDHWSRAWVSLDPDDNDPARFWTYVMSALHAASLQIDETALALLQSPRAPAIEQILTSVINDLSSLAGDVVLILDDYHVIQSAPIHASLRFLLEHAPPQLHLAIATREDPPLPLARLRARRELVEIRLADLRFTRDEAADFLTRVMGVQLSAEEVTTLEARTEGWIAGLQLAALSLQGRPDTSGFIRAFAGDDRFIVDYLVDEVLQQQPAATRRFLLDTAVLDRLSGPLCDAVTGRHDSAEMLETLERDNLFVVPLDDTRRWYRYHHLFADVLRARLQAEQPGLLPALHRRASDWYEQAGSPADAIRHALAGGDAARAADLVELAAPGMRQTRQEAMLLQWFQAIPDDVMRNRPVLSVEYASALLGNGVLDGVEERLQAAERWLDSASRETAASEMIVHDAVAFRRLPGVIAVSRAGRALALGDLEITQRAARRALDVLVPDDLVWRGAASAILGLAAWSDGDLAGAYRAYAEGMAHLQQAGNTADAVAGAITLADLRLAQGLLREAGQLYERGLRLATPRDAPVLRGAADMHVGLSALCREQGDLVASTRHLEISQELGEPLGFPQNPYRWCVAMARIREAEGDLDDALSYLQEAERRYMGDFSPNVQPIPARIARMWIAQGHLDEARNWARTCGVTPDGALSYLQEFAHLTLARLLLAEAARDGDDAALDRASNLLERLLAAAEASERWGSVIAILVVQALARQQSGDLPSALAALERAFILAEPEGYRQIFVDEGDAMRRLLGHLVAHHAGGWYARQLLRVFEEPVPHEVDVTPAPGSLVEPLTAREIEILRLIAAGLRNQEIADQLFVSLPTVKRHVANAYGKLGVSHRTEAVARANALQLL